MTSRNLRERLDKELLTNVSIRVEETRFAGHFKVLDAANCNWRS